MHTQTLLAVIAALAASSTAVPISSSTSSADRKPNDVEDFNLHWGAAKEVDPPKEEAGWNFKWDAKAKRDTSSQPVEDGLNFRWGAKAPEQAAKEQHDEDSLNFRWGAQAPKPTDAEAGWNIKWDAKAKRDTQDHPEHDEDSLNFRWGANGPEQAAKKKDEEDSFNLSWAASSPEPSDKTGGPPIEEAGWNIKWDAKARRDVQPQTKPSDQTEDGFNFRWGAASANEPTEDKEDKTGGPPKEEAGWNIKWDAKAKRDISNQPMEDGFNFRWGVKEPGPKKSEDGLNIKWDA